MSNIFHPSFGSRPERIVGRAEAIDSFVSGLQREPGHRDRARLILGQRGMGKTALLLVLAEEARKQGFVVTRVTAGNSMLEEIIEGIQIEGSEYTSEKHSRVKGFSAGALGFSFGLTFSEEINENYGFKTKLSLLCDRLAENDKGILILVDEVQPNDENMRTLASTYQNLAGENKNIAIAMAGLPASMSQVLNDKVLTFLNRARKTHLEPLSTGEVMEYYSDAFAREGKRLNREQLKNAAKAAKGFPYLLQLIGYYIIEYSKNESILSDDMFASALESARMDLEEDVFAPTLAALSAKDVYVLKAIAQEGGLGVPVSRVIESLEVSNSYFQQYRSRLIDAGVIESPREGIISITIPYLGEYLKSDTDPQ